MSDLLDLRKKEEMAKVEPQEVEKQLLNWKVAGEIKPHQQLANMPLVIAINIILTLIGVFYLIFQKSVITAVFFFLVVLVTGILAVSKKRVLNWEVNQRGLEMDRMFYPYSEIRSFWIEFDPPHLKELSIRFKKWYRPYIKIPLDREDPLALRRYLETFVTEEKHEDTIIETLTRKLGI